MKNYFEELKEYNKRNMEDSECINIISNVMKRELDTNMCRLVETKIELAAKMAKESVRVEYENSQRDSMDWRASTDERQFDYLKNNLATYEFNVKGLKEVIKFVEEILNKK